MAKNHGPQIKKPDTYEALLAQGMSEEKAARISNAQAAGTLTPRSEKLEERTRRELLAQAKDIGISNRHRMTKLELIEQIRKG